MAWFYLYDSDITATVSASAEISSSDNDSAVVKVTASGYIPAGYWIYSTGVVVTITINGQSSTQTLFGNGSYYYGSDGAKTATFSVDVPKGTGAKNVAWSVAFKRAMDGYVYDTAHTATGTIAVGALPSYTVSYNANGGSGAPSAQTKWYGSTLKLSTATPTRAGYSFLGWSTANDSSVEYAAGANYTANSGVTLYAVWKANTYTVSYNANGGTGAPGNQTKTYGVDLTLSSTIPTRTNYNFLGWATSASATSPQYAAGGKYTTNSGVTLYAVWQLAYTKPRINGLSVERCTEDGTAAEEGTYARVSFAWATDRAVSSITVTWTSVMGGSGSTNIPASGTSGNVSFVFGGGNLSTDATYTVAVAVVDSGGSTPESTTLTSIKYTIDFLQGGNGVAFGKAAEKSDVADFAWAVNTKDRVGYELYYAVSTPCWLRLGILKGYHTSAARITIGGSFSYHNPEISEAHIYAGYNFASVHCIASTPAGGNANNNTQVSEIRIHPTGNGGEHYVDIYYRLNLTRNAIRTTVEVMQGSFVPNDNPTVVDVSGLSAEASGSFFTQQIVDSTSGGIDLRSNNAIRIYAGDQSSFVYTYTNFFAPGIDNDKYLGLSDRRWKAVYSINGTIQTSDRNQKTDIRPIDQKYIDLFDKLQPATFEFKGEGHDRTHVGFISQDIEQAMQELDISSEEFAAFCRDIKMERIEVVDEETGEKTEKEVPVLDENGNPVYIYSLRYSEFIALNTRMIQESRKEITALKEENAKLKERLAKIEAMLGIE